MQQLYLFHQPRHNVVAAASNSTSHNFYLAPLGSPLLAWPKYILLFFSFPLVLALSRKKRPREPAVLARAESDIVKMQRKDIEEQLDLLKTAINEKQPSDNVINILTKLKAEVVPTEDILRVSPSTLCMTALQRYLGALALP